MVKNSRPGNDSKAWLKRLGGALVSRKAAYVYLNIIGIGGGIAVGVLVVADGWIKVTLGLLVALFFFEMQQIFYLSKKIQDMDPNSASTRAALQRQTDAFKTFTKQTLDQAEERLVSLIKTMPGLFTLATDPVMQQCLVAIGQAVSTTSREAASVVRRVVTISLEEAAKDVEYFARRKLVIAQKPEIADARWKALLELYGKDQYVIAVSWVLPEWWHLNKLWLEENEAAIKRGLQLARVFVVDDEEQLKAIRQVMQEQAELGIQVNWVYADRLAEHSLQPRDMLISNCFIPGFENPDNSKKELVKGLIFGEQVLETGLRSDGSRESGYRLFTKSVELSAYPMEVHIARGAIQQIYQLSERFNDPEWWSYFFDTDYVPITKFKDRSAEDETDMLIKNANLRNGMRVLDLGCAYGRIERILHKKLQRIEVVPVECSQQLLNEALSSGSPGFAQKEITPQDMRDIDKFYENEFDVVMSIFTSWGYFQEADNQRMFEKVCAVLNEDGVFYLDIDNPSFIRQERGLQQYPSNGSHIYRWDCVRSFDEEDSDGKKVTVPRRLSQFSVLKPDGTVKSKPLVSLRLYELSELRNIALKAGFKSFQAWEESGRPWGTDSSARAERIIVALGKKPGP
jgi:SAM-dependent methyltransferase